MRGVVFVVFNYCRFLVMQALMLIMKIESDDGFGVDYKNDWKMFTILIGSKELCSFCLNSVGPSYTHNMSSDANILIIIIKFQLIYFNDP